MKPAKMFYLGLGLQIYSVKFKSGSLKKAKLILPMKTLHG